jgi:enterochelin esterase family protein
VVPSRALRRDCPVTLYLPARFRRTVAYPLLVVHDGGDFLQYAAAKTVLDNLDPPAGRRRARRGVRAAGRPARRVRRTHPHTPASSPGSCCRGWSRELPLVGGRSGRCLLGSSFGAVAALSAGLPRADTYGALALMSGSFVFTDIAGADHGGGRCSTRW